MLPVNFVQPFLWNSLTDPCNFIYIDYILLTLENQKYPLPYALMETLDGSGCILLLCLMWQN